MIQTRKRAVIIHVADGNGTGLEGAQVRVELVSRDFPFGSAIPYAIIANSPYQVPKNRITNFTVLTQKLTNFCVLEMVRGEIQCGGIRERTQMGRNRTNKRTSELHHTRRHAGIHTIQSNSRQRPQYFLEQTRLLVGLQPHHGPTTISC